MPIAEIFFFYLAGMIILLSLVIVTRKNPMHSILTMLVQFFHIAALYLFLNAEFLAAVQIIVYAGAILVLFVFVVMMLNLKEEVTARGFLFSWPLGFVLAGGLLFSILSGLGIIAYRVTGQSPAFEAGADNTFEVGRVIFTELLFPFEVASLLLLIAVIGAIVLTKKKLE